MPILEHLAAALPGILVAFAAGYYYARSRRPSIPVRTLGGMPSGVHAESADEAVSVAAHLAIYAHAHAIPERTWTINMTETPERKAARCTVSVKCVPAPGAARPPAEGAET